MHCTYFQLLGNLAVSTLLEMFCLTLTFMILIDLTSA